MRQKTNLDLASFCVEQYKCKQVVYGEGGNLEIITPSVILDLIKSYPHFYTPRQISRLENQLCKGYVTDGLGIVRSFTGMDFIVNRQVLFALTDYRAPIETMPNTAGLILVRKNSQEISFYIGGGYVIEVENVPTGNCISFTRYTPAKYCEWVTCPNTRTDFDIDYKRGVLV